jgi:hypothetical protein
VGRVSRGRLIVLTQTFGGGGGGGFNLPGTVISSSTYLQRAADKDERLLPTKDLILPHEVFSRCNTTA